MPSGNRLRLRLQYVVFVAADTDDMISETAVEQIFLSNKLKCSRKYKTQSFSCNFLLDNNFPCANYFTCSSCHFIEIHSAFQVTTIKLRDGSPEFRDKNFFSHNIIENKTVIRKSFIINLNCSGS